MLTIEDVNTMTDEEAVAHFSATCAELYGDPIRWKSAFARDIGMQPNALHRWIAERPPSWAILLADTRAHARLITQTLINLDNALKTIATLRETV